MDAKRREDAIKILGALERLSVDIRANVTAVKAAAPLTDKAQDATLLHILDHQAQQTAAMARILALVQ